MRQTETAGRSTAAPRPTAAARPTAAPSRPAAAAMQNGMSEDEALAAALAASMSDVPGSNRNQAAMSQVIADFIRSVADQ